jgi:twinkle protein
MVNLAKGEDWNGAIFSPENGKAQHVIKLAEKVQQLPSSPKYENRMTTEQLMEGASWVGKHFHFIVSDDEGGDDDSSGLPTLKWVLEMASIAVLRFGIKQLIIDPWNELEHQRPAHQTESEYISIALAKIKRWARNHEVHVVIIAHPTKIQSDKDGNTLVPTPYQISGSANWVNKPDNIIIVHRQVSNANEMIGVTEVHVRKVRQKHTGRVGDARMHYHKMTGTYTPDWTKAEKKQFEQAEEAGMYQEDMYEFEH